VRFLRIFYGFVGDWRWRTSILALGVFTVMIAGLLQQWPRDEPPTPLSAPHARLRRPYGMAPVAFAGFVRACKRARVHPFRIGQTIGEHPRSKGYHRRDGQIVKHRRLDYCAAVDIGTDDLNARQINRLLKQLSRQGFAAWYRHGRNWEGNEHIHAVYALLPMKPQLRGQVRSFIAVRRKQRRTPRWARKMKRRYRTVRSPYIGP
jgi:hypothetical protein